MIARACVALLCLACGVAAAAWWPIDSSVSRARFSIRTLFFTHVRGGFGAVYGELRSVDDSHDVVDARIDVNSLAMDDEDALAEARGPGFFDVAHYPRIRFVSAPFPASALRDGGTLDGTLELHGQRHEARFELQPSQCPAQPMSCPVRVQGALSRSQFGMSARRGLLSDRVTLTMSIVLGASP